MIKHVNPPTSAADIAQRRFLLINFSIIAINDKGCPLHTFTAVIYIVEEAEIRNHYISTLQHTTIPPAQHFHTLLRHRVNMPFARQSLPLEISISSSMLSSDLLKVRSMMDADMNIWSPGLLCWTSI
ncbi:hypothetical protein KSP40_PGU009594 [Platanthera guangdongensis]|uniref:Uncharacterized protein n=1 Tax=Platanthera guangdongensis TaxID=2320717 RepID=A0ABR2MFY5_9ASPA